VKIYRALGAVTLGWLIGSCGGGDSVVGPPPLTTATVTVSSDTVTLVPAATVQLRAIAKDASGQPLSRSFAWSTSDPAKATVSSTGVVTGGAPGTAVITAAVDGKSGTSTITVLDGGVVSAAGGTLNLESGAVQIVVPADALPSPTNFSVVASTAFAADPRVVKGTVFEFGPKRVRLSKAVELRIKYDSINVPPGTDASALKLYLSTSSTSSTSSGWQVVSESLADVAGRVVSAQVSHFSTSAILTLAPVAAVAVSPTSQSVVVGGTQQLTATLTDANSNVLTGRVVTWSSSNPAVATVSSTGLVSGVAVGGPVTITATSETKTGTSSITVIPSTSTATLLHRSIGNPRYFENATGQVVYLTGSHTWSDLQDNGTVDPPSTFNYTAYLDFLSSRNHNFFRLWAWEQAKWTAEIAADYWISPGPYQRPGPTLALDGKPKFDLNLFNQAYFDRMRQRVIDAGSRGIYVSVMLFNGWSVATKGAFALNNPWKGHPFNAANNINGINGDTNGDGLGLEIQTLGNSAVTALQEAYVRKVIDAVSDLDNVLYEIDNEGDTTSRAWQSHMIQVIRAYEATKVKQHPIGMTPMYPGGFDADLYASAADWISITGKADAPITADGSKVLISDTDHICGICGDVSWVWKSFTKGHNPVLMDGYDGAAIGLGAENYTGSDPIWEAIRKNLGYARSYAQRMDLAAAVPHGDVVLSQFIGYCLAKLGSQYLVYVPGGGSVTLNLSAVTGTLNVEWFNPATGLATPVGTVAGGASQTLTAPFSGDAVLFLY